MQITPRSFQLAIHDIFRNRGIAPGGSLTFDMLAKAWKETRLRDADLETGLQALVQSGHLVRQRTHFGEDVRLVNDGFGRIVTDEDRQAAAGMIRARKLRTPAPTWAAPQERLGTSRRRAADKPPG